MYVAIRLYDGVMHPEEAAAKVRDQFLPIISNVSGFSEYFAIRSGDAEMTSVSVFKDKPSADEALKAATDWVQNNMSKYLPNPPKMIGGETVVHSWAQMKKSAA